jgi:hypothetical protein
LRTRLLQLSERQVQRLKRRYQPDSVGWVQHGNRGRAMPWAVSIPQKQLILRLARGKYQGFNDSHLTENQPGTCLRGSGVRDMKTDFTMHLKGHPSVPVVMIFVSFLHSRHCSCPIRPLVGINVVGFIVGGRWLIPEGIELTLPYRYIFLMEPMRERLAASEAVLSSGNHRH